MLVQEWLFHLANKARSSAPAFPENHLIERLAPVWFWSGRLLGAGERIAKGDGDIKVKVLGNTQDRLGLLRLPVPQTGSPHRGDARTDAQAPGSQLQIGRSLPQIEAVGSRSNEGDSERSSGQVPSVRAASR